MATDPNIRVLKARIQDARDIFDLVNSLSGDGTLLRRSYAEICENIRDFTIAERELEDGTTEFLGCGALHLYGPHLAEVRSIVMKPEAKGLGAGGLLLQALIDEAADHSIMSVCLFTRIPDFFAHYGFREADRNAMPDKIYKDCQTCPRLYACDEVAMVRGPLPNVAVLGKKALHRGPSDGVHRDEDAAPDRGKREGRTPAQAFFARVVESESVVFDSCGSRHVDKEFCFHELLEHKREGLRIVSRSPGESIDL